MVSFQDALTKILNMTKKWNFVLCDAFIESSMMILPSPLPRINDPFFPGSESNILFRKS